MDEQEFSNIEQIDAPFTASEAGLSHFSFAGLHADVWRLIRLNPVIFVLLPAVVSFPLDLLTEYLSQFSAGDYFSNLRTNLNIQNIRSAPGGNWGEILVFYRRMIWILR
jgi:hypothetical protein